ncbi:hypothetical protein U9M48_011917 [Paspalum notatum var. saurae]|uniref:Plant-specific domain TIGR01615 family protein n=1 Tax=Paspalum notatum var. saurae TaxID=547442 RepID=A0AAQ3WHJ2_PASNO
MTFLFPVKNQQGALEGRPPAPSRVSMFRRLMVRVTPAERLAVAAGDGTSKEREREKDERPAAAPAPAAGEAEVGSVGLDRMVLSFMEDAAAAVERPPRGRCNCFNGTQDGSDDEDFDFLPSASAPAAAPAAACDALELLKGLVQCASTAERDLLADASRIAERCGKGSASGRKKADVRRAVADGLRALGYDAAVCTSRWEKGPSHPAGEHEYIDVVVAAAAEPSPSGGAAAATTTSRLVVEVDFRSEFEVARPTKAYRAALQALPPLFVGTPDRLGRVVALVADAARQSLRKRGLHFPPWRKPEYMRAKWLAPHTRTASPPALPTPVSAAGFTGEFELRFDEKPKGSNGTAGEDDAADKKITVVVSPSPSPSPSPWPPEPEAAEAGKPSPPPQAKKGKVVTGLASVLGSSSRRDRGGLDSNTTHP